MPAALRREYRRRGGPFPSSSPHSRSARRRTRAHPRTALTFRASFPRYSGVRDTFGVGRGKGEIMDVRAGIVAIILITLSAGARAGEYQDREATRSLAELKRDAEQLCELRQASNFDGCLETQATSAQAAMPLLEKLRAAGDDYGLIGECFKRAMGQFVDWEDLNDCLKKRIAETHALDYYNAHHPEPKPAVKVKPKPPPAQRALPGAGRPVDM